MRTNAMLAAGIGMLLLVVFGATLISQYAGSTDEGGAKKSEIDGAFLKFSTTQLVYTPGSEELAQRGFPGFYEVSSELVKANFVFRNPHPVPVKVSVRSVSCSSCTSANVAVIPAERVQKYLTATALGKPLASIHPTLDLAFALAGVELTRDLDWKPIDFSDPAKGVVVPPAADKETPTWGIFQMDIRVTGIGPKQLSADVGLSVDNLPPQTQQFNVGVIGMPPFDIEPRSIALGEMPEGATPRVTQVAYWSATREPGRLPPPKLNVNVPDGFVEVGVPVAMTGQDRADLAAALALQGKAAPVLSGYRVAVTVHRRRVPSAGGPAEPDIGPFDRQVGVAGPDGAVGNLVLSGTVTGLVTLVEGGVVDLKDFPIKFGTTRENIRLVSDRPDLKLKLLPAESVPNFLQPELSEPQVRNGRTYWTLKVVVPPGVAQSEFPATSALVLQGESQGQTYRVRLPVKGKPHQRR